VCVCVYVCVRHVAMYLRDASKSVASSNLLLYLHSVGITSHSQTSPLQQNRFVLYQGNVNLKSAQPSPTQKGGIDAPFLNCTSEVTQWFLYINVTLLHKN
jgi:hypothetical protein